MKRKEMLIIAMVMYASVTFGQKAILKIEKVGESIIPANIVEEVEEEYGDYFIDHIAVVTVDIIENDYELIYKKKPVKGLFSNTYEVMVTGDDGVAKIYFDKNGNVVLYKENIKGKKLPPGLADYVAEKYAGWGVIGTGEFIKSNLKSEKIVYRVRLKNGKKQKEVSFTEKGEYLSDNDY